MGLFSKKLTSDEYEKVLKKISELNAEVALLRSEQEALKTNQNSLRGMINRRFGGEQTKEENLNTGFPFS